MAEKTKNLFQGADKGFATRYGDIVPLIRFNGFTNVWEHPKLGDVIDIQRGDRVVKKELLESGEYAVISGGVSPLGYTNNYNREAGTITIAQYGTAGFVDWQQKRFWANDVCYCIYPREIANSYLYYMLQSKQGYIYTMRTTAVPAHLPKERIEALQISLPTLQEEQERIGELFSELDGLIRAKEEELEKLRQMKSALLEAMFPSSEDEIDVNSGGG